LFSDDWLNGYADALREQPLSSDEDEEDDVGKSMAGGGGGGNAVSDYHFVYLGRRGTRTHLHADVLGSYSWSTNVCGTKKWRFLAPQNTYLVRDVFGRKLASEFLFAGHGGGSGEHGGRWGGGGRSGGKSGKTWNQKGYYLLPPHTLALAHENAAGRGEHWRFPLLAEASERCMEVIQQSPTSTRHNNNQAPRDDSSNGSTSNHGAGSSYIVVGSGALFVPSEWHHTVSNEQDALSVNCNWFNRHSLCFVFRRLKRDATAASAASRSRRKRRTTALSSEDVLASPLSHPLPAGATGADAGAGAGAVAVPPLSARVSEEEEGEEEDKADQQEGKPPFDASDFVSLLAWKTDKATLVLQEQLQRLKLKLKLMHKDEEKEDTLGRTAAALTAAVADLQEIAVVAGLIAETGEELEMEEKEDSGCKPANAPSRLREKSVFSAGIRRKAAAVEGRAIKGLELQELIEVLRP
jgi:hypothetical protein